MVDISYDNRVGPKVVVNDKLYTMDEYNDMNISYTELGMAITYLYGIYKNRNDHFKLSVSNIMRAENRKEAIEREYRRIGPWVHNG